MNRTKSLLALLPLLFATGVGSDTTVDPECGVDTDNDGQVDCRDADDDNDGLADGNESSLGTDPKDTDSDRDGLSDLLELTTLWPCTNVTTSAPEARHSNPTVPTLLIEVDSLPGFRPSKSVLEIAEQSFEAAGIETIFWLDEPSVQTPSSPLLDLMEIEALLSDLDSATDAELFRHYLHVVFAGYGEDRDHGKSHFARPNDPSRGDHGNSPDPRFAGSFVWAHRVIDDFEANRSALERIGLSLDMLIARSFVHEIGHLLGCAHEGDANDGIDFTNVMVMNSMLGNPADSPPHWEAQFAVGYPSFSRAALVQMDLAFKASVETGSSPLVRRFDMGPSGSRVAPGYLEVTEDSAYETSLAFGFHPPLPSIASAEDFGDERHSDFVRGDPSVTRSTRFRITNLGEQPVDLRFRLGATVDREIEVRCEVTHPGRITAFREGPIGPSSGFQETRPDLIVYPNVTRNSLGYTTTAIVLACLDEVGRWDDAPIELVEIRKRET